MRKHLRAHWDAAGELPGWPGITWVRGAEAEARVVDAGAGPGAVPTLVLCEPHEIGQVLRALGPRSDVCLRGAPPALLAHRLCAVAATADPVLDPLTRVSTRRALLAALERAVEPQLPLSVVLVDLDRFKALNDTNGHEAGDAVLVEVAARIATEVGAVGLVCRYGGEEFAALISGTGAEATALAERILAAICAGPAAGHEVTASAGVATAQTLAAVRALLPQADEALYAAKARGRARAVHAGALRDGTTDWDRALDHFEHRARVLTQRAADAIARQGREMLEQLRHTAEIDALTGLYTRRYFDTHLPEVLVEARAGVDVVLAQLDVDDFGRINKERGWPTGDRVLTELAERIRSTVRAADWVARRGGDELFVVMRGVGLEGAARVLERVRHAVSDRPFAGTDGAPVHVTVSVGLARVRPDDDTEALLERVSELLLAAKRSGKDRLSRPEERPRG